MVRSLTVDTKCLYFSDGWRIITRSSIDSNGELHSRVLLFKNGQLKALTPRYRKTIWMRGPLIISGWEDYWPFDGPVSVENVVCSLVGARDPENHTQLANNHRYEGMTQMIGPGESPRHRRRRLEKLKQSYTQEDADIIELLATEIQETYAYEDQNLKRDWETFYKATWSHT